MSSLIESLVPRHIKQAQERGRDLDSDELYVAKVLHIRDIESEVFKDALEVYKSNKEKVESKELAILTKDVYTAHKIPMQVIKVTEHCVLGKYLREW